MIGTKTPSVKLEIQPENTTVETYESLNTSPYTAPMDDNLESVVAGVGLFIDNILSDMKNVSKSTTKPVILAHIDAWKNELETIKQFTKT
jgi:hypothetical protein